MKTKKTHFTIVCISILITFVFTLTLALSLLCTKAKADTYTVYADDDYYSETTYYLTENAYNRHLEEAKATTADTKSVTKSAVSSKDDDSEFVVAATKKVCVNEVADENGNIIESRLLKKSEIEDIKQQDISTKTNYKAAKASTASWEVIGDDKTNQYYLTIDLGVFLNHDTGNYTILGHAGWEAILVSLSSTYKAAEEDKLDYLGITWGGDSTLYDATPKISGKYHNDKQVNFSKREFNPFAGCVWQFHEKSGLFGKELKRAEVNVLLKKEGSYIGKTTIAQLTYIHTYEKFNGSVSLSLNNDGALATGISISQSSDSWQVQIAVMGIKY